MTQTRALRIYDKHDLRLETFDLPALKDDEILADVRTNSICMSTYKVLQQGAAHKRVPADIAENPIIVGHEMCGEILEVGAKHKDLVKVGAKYSLQPALNLPGREFDAPGYSFRYLGGHATKIIIPKEVMEQDCLLSYEGEGYFQASLAEPVSCVVGGFNVQYHFGHGSYEHKMGIDTDGNMALLGGTGPMGLGAIDYALHGPKKPKILIVTDIDQARLDRAASLFTVADAKANGVELHYINTGGANPVQDMRDITDGKGYADVFVFAPVGALIEQASAIMGTNGCLNFFAGPSDTAFKATINFYDIHYASHHVAANSGGDTNDMRIALKYMGEGKLTPAVMITHIGGLNAAAETIANLPNIPGGKKLIYTNPDMPLVALDDLADLGKDDAFYAKLAEITANNNGLWSNEAETYLMANAPVIG
ncbi:MAG: zinc-binding dehydrogenase [Candidatus Hydrogenedentes bacterium]|nr:zinc-binding dehydrogenase [Candidatus Hydrogenedentota bacterium]